MMSTTVNNCGWVRGGDNIYVGVSGREIVFFLLVNSDKALKVSVAVAAVRNSAKDLFFAERSTF